MKTFPTDTPITAVIEAGAGELRVSATDQVGCVVDIQPRDPANPADVRSAQRVNAELVKSVLTVKTPGTWRRFTGPKKDQGAVVIRVSLPTRSSLDATVGMGSITVDGEFDAVATTTGMGDVRVDQARTLSAKSGLGDVTADAVAAMPTFRRRRARFGWELRLERHT